MRQARPSGLAASLAAAAFLAFSSGAAWAESELDADTLDAPSVPFHMDFEEMSFDEVLAEEGSKRLDVPFVPTPMEVVDKMLEFADPQEGEYLIDLGSGDGRIPVEAAKKYKVRALGVDLDPKRVQEGIERAKRERVTESVEFKEQDLFDTDISEADILTMYLLQSVNERLRPRILKEMRPGARVVSHAFTMGPWEPLKEESVDGSMVYMWIVPARADGKWVLANGSKEFELAIRDETDEVPELDITAEANGKPLSVDEIEVHGEVLRFQVELEGETHKFETRVEDGELVDIESDAGGKWEANPA
jgi:precorrin-6B methylase 2